ncbi:MAG: DNA repair protein RadC [Alphaproteobacteria bacterium]|nr:DNA repair protein RadC [Alphaproteobacteria bacterium]
MFSDRPPLGFDDGPLGSPDHRVGHRARMRARMMEGGADAFHDYELVEYVLSLVTPRRHTKPLAKQLITEFGGLPGLLAASPAELSRVPGLGETGIAALKFVHAAAVRSLRANVTGRPVLSSWQAVLDYLHADMAHRATEAFQVLFLNARNTLIRAETASEGTVDHTPVFVREIIRRALELNATALILVHNHPSGDPRPSRDDIAMTDLVVEAGRHLGITVHDHIVISDSGHASFKALGFLR